MRAFFDFDHTLVDANSDTFVFETLDAEMFAALGPVWDTAAAEAKFVSWLTIENLRIKLFSIILYFKRFLQKIERAEKQVMNFD